MEYLLANREIKIELLTVDDPSVLKVSRMKRSQKVE